MNESQLITWEICSPNNLPSLGERVLITDDYCVFEAYRGLKSSDPKGWAWLRYIDCVCCINDCVTRWMPLPKPPKEIKGE